MGLCCAYSLLEAGHEVTLMDQTDLSDGCSFGNAGMLAPSHVVPLAAPGMVAQGMRWMLRPDSPFYIRPRLSLSLFRWGMQFMRAATEKRMAASIPVLHTLGKASRTAFGELIRKENIDCDFAERGYLMLYQTEKGREYELHHGELARKAGIEAREVGAEDVLAMNPGMDIRCEGAVFYPDDAQLSPDRFLRAFIRILKEKGLKILRQHRMNGLETKQGRVTAVYVRDKLFKADAIVIAAGAWSPKIARKLGIKLSLLPGKGYSFALDPPAQQAHIPMILSEAKVAVTPMGSRLRFAGTLEIGGLDHKINKRRVAGIARAIPKYFPGLKKAHFDNLPVWAGLRPCSPDGLPYIGAAPPWKNVYFATGHAMLGLSLAPVTGEIIAGLLTNGEHPLAVPALSPVRYG